MENNSEFKDYSVNGIPVTKYRQLAVELIIREANGENFALVASDAWRRLFRFPANIEAKEALEIVK